ncbi:POZ domain-containing protein [Ascobolus immersus RN42]|uniref:POZ domain-containing protein n=1 Tax=Ascobolus immersus RN42 TaxID=1160509 RepID=A0A3N4HKC1_ASCIM|nr:POZ domain-containing protein [Ascobolus immersus RN42]
MDNANSENTITNAKRSFDQVEHATNDDTITESKRVCSGPRIYETLKDGNLALLRSGDYSDLVLKCEGEEFKVHKAILCPQSEFFRGCVESGMKESITNEIELVDENVAEVKMMLHYIYLEDFPDDLLDHYLMLCLRLFALADKYGVLGMKKKAVDQLEYYLAEWSPILSCHNVLDALEFCSSELSGVSGSDKVIDSLLDALAMLLRQLMTRLYSSDDRSRNRGGLPAAEFGIILDYRHIPAFRLWLLELGRSGL